MINRLIFGALLLLAHPAVAQERVLDARMHHLRAGAQREWAEFPVQAEGSRLEVAFTAHPNEEVLTLRLRQEDVKESWLVHLNGRDLGRLHQDENGMTVYWPVPAGALIEGQNRLTIEAEREAPDDIYVGAIALHAAPPEEILAEARVDVTVTDSESGAPVPGRITIVNAERTLQMVSAPSGDSLAVRPGVVYTGTGRAFFGLPAGSYVIYAGRGFEYSVDSTQITVKPGDRIRLPLSIRREVPTEGYVSMDTHIHTVTHSGHGDATDTERAVTLAGEGIELAVATEHNRHISYETAFQTAGVRPYVTPMIGNEVTTRVGHFNIFPVEAGAPVPDHRPAAWDSIFAGIYDTPGVRVVVLNHARDVHSGFIPFGPVRHLAVAGERADGWVLRANAMEVINSGAQQTDGMQLYRDWSGMLNRGHLLTPVGASDSHDVSRFIVGQARTYVRVDDNEPGRIDVDEAVEHFVEGRVNVSLGLLAEIVVDGQYGPGDLVPVSDTMAITVRVLGPGWTKAERVELYANGRVIEEAIIKEGDRPGVKWEHTWRMPRPAHDVFLSAVAHGPGVAALFWPIAKPYQPTSPEWEPYVLGMTGAVWIDGDGDGRRSSAFDYAQRLMEGYSGDLPALIRVLNGYDEAVAVQVASLLARRGGWPADADFLPALQQAASSTREGFQLFREALERHERGN